MADEPNLDPIARLTNSFNAFVSQMGSSFLGNFSAEQIAITVKEVDDAAVNIAKSFGQGRENVLGLSRAMAGAVREVTLLGGGFKDIADIQQLVSRNLGRNLVLVTESYEKLYAAQQVSGENAQTIVSSFKDAGFSAYQAASQMENVVNVARSIGVNAQVVSGKVLENMDALNKYNFEGGVQGLAKMAAQATMLRIEMRDTLNFAEKVFDPEGAIEVAAAMQRLGVANSELLDPLRLMDLSQNDPAELQNQLANMTQQFVQLNKEGRFEIMPDAKRQLREISSALNIPFETLTKMAIGTKELDEKLQRINFAGFSFTEDQQRMIANMAEMGEDGEFKISMDGKPMNLDDAVAKIESMGEDERKAFFESQQPKTLEELAKEQLTVSQSIDANTKSLKVMDYAFAGTTAAKDALTAVESITREVSTVLTGIDSMNITKLTEGLEKGTTTLLQAFNDVASGEKGIPHLINALSDAGSDLESFAGNFTTDVLDKLSTSTDRLSEANNQYINILLSAGDRILNFVNGVTPNIQQGNDIISSGYGQRTLLAPEGAIQLNNEDTVIAGTNLFPNPQPNPPPNILPNNMTQMSTQPQTMTVGGDINLKVTVDVPNIPNPNVIEEISKAFTNPIFTEKMTVKIMETLVKNTSSNPNPQQRFNQMRNMMAGTA
jgi:hypothetical protein